MSDAPQAADAAHLSGADRPQALVRIAFRQIAERGFEGLRVREVAKEAGVNHATVLYHYPTKEALIQAVVAHLAHEFRTPVPGLDDPDTSALGELRREFADIRHRARATPQTFLVLGELAVRSRRDPAIARILQALFAGWQGHLVAILRRGIAEGRFRADLDIDATVLALRTQLATIGYQVLEGDGGANIDLLVRQLASQTEYWLAASAYAGAPGREGTIR